MQRSKKSTLLTLAAAMLAAASCSPGGADHSAVQEAPTEQNNLGKVGLDRAFNWLEVQGPKSYSLPFTPWTDTYWATYMKGLAYRFQDVDPTDLDTFSLHAFLVKLFSAVDSGDPYRLNLLSPAEKHDLVLGKDLKKFGQLSREQVLEQAKGFDDEARKAFAKLGPMAPDKLAKAKMAILRQSIAQGAKLMQQNIASQLPLTAASWLHWAQVAGNPANQLHIDPENSQFEVDGTNIIDSEARNWGWEGLCHGWAAAAAYAPKPKHAVMLKTPEGKDVLFTEGDIRGLLTKAWADNKNSVKAFVGGRCNVLEDELREDQYGRSLDGSISCESNAKFPGCKDKEILGIHIAQKFELFDATIVEYRIWNSDSDGEAGYILLTDDGYDTFSGAVFDSVADIKAWVKKGRPERAKFTFNEQKQCRDVNPMSMHILLTKHLTKGQGFVMDRTRSAQVWNQPVKGYKLDYVAIPGSKVAADQPTPVEQVRDAHWRERAKGTRYLVQVEAELSWVAENGPRVTYRPTSRSGRIVDIDDQSVHPLALAYTLELDADYNLIGGEWGLIPDPDAAEKRLETRNGPAPDFIYMYDAKQEPVVSLSTGLDYRNIVKKVHACSLDESAPLKSIVVDSQTIAYSDCR